MPPAAFDAVVTMSLTADALGIVTVTPTAGTTTIFITSSSAPTSTSSPSKGGSNASQQKAVIAGSVVGGFVGFSILLGLGVWLVYFRKSEASDGEDGTRGTFLCFGRRRKNNEKRGRSSSVSHAPLPTSEPAHETGEKTLDRPNPVPLQPHSTVTVADEPPAHAHARPTPQRTITSVSDSDGPRRIPVVMPSFAYRDSVASNSSGPGSRLANVLKRGSGAHAAPGSSPSSAPYQYGMVGSAESRGGPLLSAEALAVPGYLPAHAYDEDGRLVRTAHGPSASSEQGSLSLPYSSEGSSNSRPPLGRAHHVAYQSASTNSASAPSGMAISGTGSGSGHSADSNHPLIMAAAINAAASSSSHNSHSQSHSHSHDHDRTVPPGSNTNRDRRSRNASNSSASPVEARVQKGLPPRPTSSGSLDEHIALSNYILPPSALSSASSLPGSSGKKNKLSKFHEKGSRDRGATVSESGHAGDSAGSSESQPIASGLGSTSMFANFQRSLSLDLSSSGNKLKRQHRGAAPSQSQSRTQPPSSPLTAERLDAAQIIVPPTRQASPPPSSYYRHLTFTATSPSQPASGSSPPSPAHAYAPVANHASDRDTSDDNDPGASSSTSAEAERRRRSRRPRRRTGSASGGGSGNESADHARYAHHASHVSGHRSRSRAGSGTAAASRGPSTGTSDEGGLERPGDEELARLARDARRAERRIRRASRAVASSDPGHGDDRQRRSSRQRPSSGTRRDRAGSAGSRAGQGPEEHSTTTRPQLVLRNV